MRMTSIRTYAGILGPQLVNLGRIRRRDLLEEMCPCEWASRFSIPVFFFCLLTADLSWSFCLCSAIVDPKPMRL